MTIKTIKKISSELALSSRDTTSVGKETVDVSLPPSVLEAWTSLPEEVRKALVIKEVSSTSSHRSLKSSSHTASGSTASFAQSSSVSSSSSDAAALDEFVEECPATGGKVY